MTEPSATEQYLESIGIELASETAEDTVHFVYGFFQQVLDKALEARNE